LKTSALAPFFQSELRSVPGVRGEVNYLLDGSARVLAASDGRAPLGTPLLRSGASGLVHRSGDAHGSFFQQATLTNSDWRVVLVAPDGALFASVNGTRELVPWIVFAALVLAALIAGFLAYRVIRGAEVVTDVNAKLADVNVELSMANESLHRRAAELARSNEELDSFASIASHDLQEPLRKVRTFTEQLTVLEAHHLSEKGRDYLGRTNAAAARMQNLIDDLLRFSRVSTQGRPFGRVDLAEVTQRVIDDLEQQIEDAGARVEVGPLPVITADPLQMRQLLQNLVSNAVKFHRPDVPPVIRVEATIDGSNLHLTVADNGIGFEPRYAARIFRIFERLHGRSSYAGTGIGLALCRKIADRHGGTIEAESELGQGATFTVTLPAAQPEGSFGFGVAPDQQEQEESEARAGV
jgi:signal transduction histidine kinase